MRFGDLVGLTIVSGSLLVAQPRQAQACGGYFHAEGAATEVTTHRIAFALSSTRTVLWDQIQYSGDPKDFSWVLPVKGDANPESANDSWFEALDGVSGLVTTPPHLDCYVHRGGSGCDCSSTTDIGTPVAGPAPAGVPGAAVMIVHQRSVGPYMYVQLRASDAKSLLQWLPDNGYAIPADIKPVIEAYQNEGFDFVALRLHPDMGTHQMTPVRIVTQGTSPVLPLRLAAAGAGDHLSISLYVIAEGRYEAAGFNNKVNVDYSQLTFDWRGTFDTTQGETNYPTLLQQALAAGDGKNWLTSFAAHPGLTRTYKDATGAPITFVTDSTSPSKGGGVSGIGIPGTTFSSFAQVYFRSVPSTSPLFDSGLPSSVAGGLNDSRLVVDDLCPTSNQTGDAGTSGNASCQVTVDDATQQRASALVSNGLTDIAAAMIGMHPSDVWITRLDANLPRAALAADLKIALAADQTEVTDAHLATQHANPPCDLLQNHDVEIVSNHEDPRARKQQAGVGAMTALGLLIARRASRRGGRDRFRSRRQQG
jgi:hypothetical protein